MNTNGDSKMNSPFKLLDAYEKNDRDIFFGRKKEIEVLYETSLKTDLLLVYGETGTGKTSLIKCGLANRFDKTDWCELYIKRGENINVSLWREIFRNTQKNIAINATIPEALRELYLEYLRPIYLIFDQFEELFILGTKQEQQSFFESISLLQQSGVSCKVILVMREEYISRLYEYEHMLEALFENRIRVEPLKMSNLEEVIRGSAEAFDITLEDPEKTVAGILENNRDIKGMILLPYLQVYLDKLYMEAKKTPTAKKSPTPEKNTAKKDTAKKKQTGGMGEEIVFNRDLVKRTGKIDKVMASFLNEQTWRIEGELKKTYPEEPLKAAWQVLNKFVTPEGTSQPMQKETLYSKCPEFKKELIDFCLDQWESARILRYSDKNNTCEIAHDSLAKLIDDKRSVEDKALQDAEILVNTKFKTKNWQGRPLLLSNSELQLLKPYLERLVATFDTGRVKYIKKSREIAAMKGFVIGAFIFILMGLLYFLGSTISQWKSSRKQTEIAEESLRKSRAFYYNTQALLNVEKDPTVALRLAENAWKLDPGSIVSGTIGGIYWKNSFYKTILKKKDKFDSAHFSRNDKPDDKSDDKPEDQYILAVYDRSIHKFDLNGKELGAVHYAVKKDYPRSSFLFFLPKGKHFVFIKDESIHLYDSNQKELVVLKGFKAPFSSGAISSDGQYILLGFENATFGLYNLKEDLNGDLVVEALRAFKGSAEVDDRFLSISPDNEFFVFIARDETVRLWDLYGKEIRVFKGHTETINTVTFSPDERYILTGSDDDTARLWNIYDEKKVILLEGHENSVTAAAFSPGGQYILTASEDGTARLWDLQGLELKIFKGYDDDEIVSAVFSPDGKTILTGSKQGVVRAWKLNNVEKKVFRSKIRPIGRIAISPDCKRVFLSKPDSGSYLWELKENKLRQFESNRDISVLAVAFSPDGKSILIGSGDNTIQLWHLDSSTLEPFGKHKGAVTSVAFSPDGERIITGSRDHTACLWDRSGNKLKVFEEHEGDVISTAISPDGMYLLTGSTDGTARLWDLKKQESLVVCREQGKKNAVTSVAFSPDGNYILTGSEGNATRLWNLKGNQIQLFNVKSDAVTAAVFSSDSKYILSSSRRRAILWDLNGGILEEFTSSGGLDDVVNVYFSPDGKYIAIGWDNGEVHVMENKTLLENFLKKGDFDELSEEQKKKYGIEE
ncbi:MAG: hypothetical protein GY757_52795 [bacterium]|nr:hypothetical protein [bacterium]